MLQDLQFALRLFARERGFFVTAVFTIALGIGLSATVFAVVDGVLFRALPFRDPGRLVAVYATVKADDQWTMSVAYPEWLDWRAGAPAFEALEGYEVGGLQARLRGTEETTQVPAGMVTSGFFEMLGVQAATGRTLVASDFEPGAAPAAVISHRVWRGASGGEPDVLGRSIERGDQRYTIVGVMPRTFVFPTPPRRFAPDVIVPLAAIGTRVTDRTSRSMFVIGRLRQGATMGQAQAQLGDVAERIEPLFVVRPNTSPGATDGAHLMGLRDQLTRQSRAVLWLVFGAAAAVFLIGCLNVVSLLLARGEERRRELAVRSALGAGRAALLRQLLVEAGLLAVVGAGAGRDEPGGAWRPLVRIPRWLQLLGDPDIDRRTLVFAGTMALLTVVIGGLVPAWRASVEAPRAALGGGGRPVPGVRGGRALLLAEVVLATVALCADSSCLRSEMLNAEESGMDADRVIALAAPAGVADRPRRTRFNAIIADAVGSRAGRPSRRVPRHAAAARRDQGLLFEPLRQVRYPAGMDTDVRVTRSSSRRWACRSASGAVCTGRRSRHRRRRQRGSRGAVLARTESRRRDHRCRTARARSSASRVTRVTCRSIDRRCRRFTILGRAGAPIATVVVRFAGPSDRLLYCGRVANPAAAITMLSTVDDLIAVSMAPRH